MEKINTYQFKEKMNEFQMSYLESALSRSYMFDKFDVDYGSIKYLLKNISDKEKAVDLFEKLIRICGSLNQETIYSQVPTTPFSQDAMSMLIKDKAVIRVTDASYVMQGLMLNLMQFYDRYFLAYAQSLNSIEQYYPVRWPVDLFRKIDYFKEFPQNILLISGVKKENNCLTAVANKFKKENDFSSIELDDSFDHADTALGTSTCDPCYYVLSNNDNLNNNVYTALNKCFRNETTSGDSLERLKEFSMREIITVGNLDFVLETRDRFVNFAIEFVKLINIDVKIETANDPFFTNDSILKSFYQRSVNSKYEILAKVNYLHKYLSVGSINWHGNYFGKVFNVKLANGNYIFSSCLAFGLERLVFAFLSQYGMNKEHWPEEFAEKYKSFVENEKSFSSELYENHTPSTDKEKMFNDSKPPASRKEAFFVAGNISGPEVYENVKHKLHKIFCSVFGLSGFETNVGVDDLEQWDSMNHIRLILEMEKEFHIKINTKNSIKLYSNFENILNYLVRKS